MAIKAKCGKLGQGKTYSMVRDAVTHLASNHCMVYTNMAGLRFPEAVYIDNIETLCDISTGLVLLDEAAIVIPAQFWHGVGQELLARFMQLRKAGLDLWYTAQRFEGVNTNMRTVTNEITEVRRWGSWIQSYSYAPGEKTVGFGDWKKMEQRVYDLYETLEVIGSHGGSVGYVDASPLSLAARKRSEHREARRVAAIPSPRPLFSADFSGIPMFGGSITLSLPPRVKRVYDWVYERNEDCTVGGWLPEWPHLVRSEIRRRAWLAEFGMTFRDVPDDCTPENPWLKGFDPATVRERSRQEKLALAQNEVMRLSRGRRQAV